jgi:hypothetical protein
MMLQDWWLHLYLCIKLMIRTIYSWRQTVHNVILYVSVWHETLPGRQTLSCRRLVSPPSTNLHSRILFSYGRPQYTPLILRV